MCILPGYITHRQDLHFLSYVPEVKEILKLQNDDNMTNKSLTPEALGVTIINKENNFLGLSPG